MTKPDPALEQAVARQNDASTPFVSSWVSANAGSGKTRVLTDRVARLLLQGVDPQRILCLTYTKAAAAEMQERLFNRLGAWAMMPDRELAEALGKIGEAVTPAALPQARTLFARALETPGGLKIQTIHAFCAQVLRRFPLEAGISPQFKEMDDRASKLLVETLLEEMADEPDGGAFAPIAVYLNDPEAAYSLAMDCLQNRALLARFDAEAAASVLGVDPNQSAKDIESAAVADIRRDVLRDIRAAIITHGSDANRKYIDALSKVDLDGGADQVFKSAHKSLFKADGDPRNTSSFPVKPVEAAVPGIRDTVQNVIDRILVANEALNALDAYDRTRATVQFAADFTARFEVAKQAQGLLDFDDLIERVAQLLEDPGRAAWVQYRIDAGLDHILVDEAQDTAPRQWDIIKSLEAEFTDTGDDSAGQRTLFVVGDPKQSIFGFQGADVAGFSDKRAHFADRLARLDKPLQDVAMAHSFRSAGPILQLVDRVFETSTGMGQAPSHKFFANKPGRVDLWPFLVAEKSQNKPEPFSAEDLPSTDTAAMQLAQEVAGFVADALAQGQPIPDGAGGWRALTPGDVMILVRSRSPFFHNVIAELKRRDVPVAGADKLRLLDVLAVLDVMSLLKFLDNDLDDLALAEALRSPLFEMSEHELYELATGREGNLWAALRGSGHREIYARLSALRNASDFERPYNLIEMLLSEQGGRLRLNARLGPETDEALDELLALALGFERETAPSLTNFIAHVFGSEIEIKRQMDKVVGAARVMTVHGAKGLEAPLVIVPSLKGRTTADNMQIVEADGLPFVTAGSKLRETAALDPARAQIKAREQEELDRLLYVALTRAEYWLVVCGAGQSYKPEDWYGMAKAGFAALHGEDAQTIQNEHWRDDPMPKPAEAAAPAPLPAWLDQPAPSASPPEPVINPSQLPGAHALPGAQNDESDRARYRGDLIHNLLETLPQAAPADRGLWAARILGGDPDAPAILAEVEALLDAPQFAPLFAPDALSEVELSAAGSGRRIIGRVDRLLVSKSSVECIDFKSNREVPPSAAQVPSAVLAQMGSYHSALTQIWPDHEIICKILWTRNAELMPLPQSLIADAFERAVAS